MAGDFDDARVDELRRRRTVKWTLYGPDVLAAWVAETDFALAPPVRAALTESIERSDLGYPPADTSDTSEACAEFLAASYGWDVPAARIFLVADVLAGISAALGTFVERGAAVVLPTPAYPPFFAIIELSGHRVVEVPLADEGGRPVLDLDAVAGALSSGARAVLLCNPQNPTGRVFGPAELGALASVVDHHGARVIADEVHAPLVYGGTRFVPYAALSEVSARHTLTVTSASKGWNIPGLKCAQVIASNHDDAARWRALPLFSVPEPTPLGIVAATAAYRHGRPWLAELVAYLDGNRHRLGELLAAQIPAVRYRAPEGTYLAWLDCGGLGTDDPAGFFLEKAKVAVSDGPAFGAGYGRFVRLNFGTSRRILEQIVAAMAGSVRGR